MEKAEEGTIFKIKRFSIHDGPGIRTSVFLKGCPLRCVWCHSPEGMESNIVIWHNPADCIGCSQCVRACPEKALELNPGTGHIIKINRAQCTLSGDCVRVCPSNAIQFTGYKTASSDVIAEILKDKIFYDSSGGGVTLTGGEPLFQPDFSREILRVSHQKGINTAIETCLFCEREVIESVIDYIDLIMVDLKIFSDQEHLQFTGKSNELIKSNFHYIAKSGKRIIVRIPMIRNITDNEENINSIDQFVHEINDKIEIEKIAYNPLTRNNYDKLGMTCLL